MKRNWGKQLKVLPAIMLLLMSAPAIFAADDIVYTTADERVEIIDPSGAIISKEITGDYSFTGFSSPYNEDGGASNI